MIELAHPKGALHCPLGTPCPVGSNIQCELPGGFLIRAATYTALTTADAVPSNAEELRSTPEMLRGTFPLGLPECIRQTAFPCVRGLPRRIAMKAGPDRPIAACRRVSCWQTASTVLQQPRLLPLIPVLLPRILLPVNAPEIYYFPKLAKSHFL